MAPVTARVVIPAVVAAMLVAGPAVARSLLADDFSGRDGLVTNERVVDDEDSAAPRSPIWIVTSGSLFRRGGWGWTGEPDAESPDVCSCRTTGSAIFRMISRRSGLGDVSLRLRMRNVRLTSTRHTPPLATDGLHLMLRYRSERETYYVSVDRRDGQATIKRKVPGGPSNGGTYVTLAETRSGAIPFGRVRRVRADVRDDRACGAARPLGGRPARPDGGGSRSGPGTGAAAARPCRHSRRQRRGALRRRARRRAALTLRSQRALSAKPAMLSVPTPRSEAPTLIAVVPRGRRGVVQRPVRQRRDGRRAGDWPKYRHVPSRSRT